MKYIKNFETMSQYETFKDSEEYILPNVTFVMENTNVLYTPVPPKEPELTFMLRAKYNATENNLVAFNGASNIKSLKVNGTPIEIEPLVNESTNFDVLGENISLDMETSTATFPDSYLIKSPVTSWSFKAKDPNYVINENTYVCLLAMMDGMTTVEPIPLSEAMGYAFTTTDGVTLEVADTFLSEMNMQIQYGLQVGFILMDVDMNSGTFVFIDTEHQAKVTTGGLSTYSFDSEGLYDVEIELSDPNMKGMRFAETSLISIEIGDDITTIGNEAFSGCTGLAGELVIPDSVTSIGDFAFDGCSGLTSLTLGSGFTTIETCTFRNCYGLTSVAIPDSVTTIGEQAFNNCSGLTGITFGSGVITIGKLAFCDCSELSEIICKGNIAPQIQNTTFGYQYGNIKKFGVLTVPDNADYSSWMRTDKYYLGYYGWTIQEF